MATPETNMEVLKKELETLKGDLKDIAASVKDFGKSVAREGKESLSDQISLEEIQKSINDLKRRGMDGVDIVSQNIKDEPFKSVGITLAVGFALGWLLRK